MQTTDNEDDTTMEVNNLTTDEYQAIEVSLQKITAPLQKMQSPAALQDSVGDDLFASFLGSCARHSRENATEWNDTKSRYPEINTNSSSRQPCKTWLARQF
jgi:hypothetical protein